MKRPSLPEGTEFFSHYRWCRLMDRVMEAARANDLRDMRYYQLLMDKEKEKPNE